MTDFASLVEYHLQLAGIAFDHGELISFLEANRSPAHEAPDAGEWAAQFASYLREQAAAVVEWH
jgi:hypothetical protein